MIRTLFRPLACLVAFLLLSGCMTPRRRDPLV